jgi:hypothetical protein
VNKDNSKKISRRTFIAGTSVFLLTGLLSKYTLPVDAKEVSDNLKSPFSTNVSDAYDYPIRPGTDEWRKLHNMVEKYQVCQIPEDILKNMSTLGLVETVLDYPNLFLYTAYNDMQYGFDVLVANFNGLQELYNRKDAGSEILNIFLKMYPAAINEEWTDIQKGGYAFSFLNIEMLLMQESILDNLIPTEHQLLIDRAVLNQQQMKTIPELYSAIDFEVTSMLIERASGRQYADREYSTYVYTPKHTPVLAVQKETSDELSNAERLYWDVLYNVQHFNAQRVREPTAMYDCHSYAWHNQSSDNTIWIDSPNQETYWEDGSYSEWTGAIFLGLRVDYTSSDHSAIVHSLSPLKFISKWGRAGLYIHNPDDSPYGSLFLVLTYYTPY